MITVKVTFEDGDYLTTGINTDLDGAKQYYEGRLFNLGCVEDHMVKAVKVEEIDYVKSTPETV